MAKVLLESGNYRLVDGGGCYHVEKNGGTDALGVVRWNPVEKVTASWRTTHGGIEEAEDAAEIPAAVFRAMCERIKEKVSL